MNPSTAISPTLAIPPCGAIGALPIESSNERFISAANIAMAEDNTLLDDKEPGLMVFLRLNGEFNQWARSKDGNLACGTYCETEDATEENEEDK